MGRKNKAYSKDLHQQAYERLQGMLSFGESEKKRPWRMARTERRYFPSTPTNRTGSTLSIF